jgi:hypothetical protein
MSAESPSRRSVRRPLFVVGVIVLIAALAIVVLPMLRIVFFGPCACEPSRPPSAAPLAFIVNMR